MGPGKPDPKPGPHPGPRARIKEVRKYAFGKGGEIIDRWVDKWVDRVIGFSGIVFSKGGKSVCGAMGDGDQRGEG